MSDSSGQRPGDSQITDRMPENPVTDRFIEQQVTDRFNGPSASVTDRFVGDQVTDIFTQFNISRQQLLDALKTKKGDHVADRYLIEEGPIGGSTGEAELFLCRDEEEQSVRVILKFYRYNVTPKTGVLDQLLSLDHPDIVSLKAYGTWMERFYEVMEYCEGGNLSDYMPLNEAELKVFLKKIANGLNFCHDRGIIHRDIKPSNLFFRLPKKKDVVIADFGISSILQSDEKVRKTGTHRNLTLDYAAPELLFYKTVSPKTDYYALGITLIHLSTGLSPFHKWDDRSVMAAHLIGNIPIPQHISPEFRQLIEGLIQVRPENRWGYRQVLSWLNGEAIFADSGAIWREDAYSGQNHPYSGCAEAKNPRELASAFDKFNVEFDLFHRRISPWVHLFDAGLSDRIVDIEENYTDRKQLGVFRLRYLLDPALPFVIGGAALHTIEQLVDLLQTDDKAVLTELENALWGENIECWIDAADIVKDKSQLLKQIGAIRGRLKNANRRTALYALLYTLDPRVPLKLAAKRTISKPEELENLVSKDANLLKNLEELLFTVIFEEWLRAAFPDREGDIGFLARCKRDFNLNRSLGVFALRCRFHPSLFFPFGKYNARDPKELAKFIDYNDDSRKYGIQNMTNGWIMTWLTATGRMKDSGPFEAVLNETGASPQRKLEALLHLLDPALPLPKPVADQKTIDLGKISTESQKNVSITFKNGGRGFLSGIISLVGSGRGFSINKQAIEGEPVKVEVVVRALGLPAGSRQNVTIKVQTNGGVLEVPVTYKVSVPIYRMIGRSMVAGTVFGACMFFIRYLFGNISPLYRSRTINFFSWDIAQRINNQGISFLLAFLLAAVFAGCIYYVIRMMSVKK